jgi:imidazole glycerol-phosphate synthase subunit HisH
MSIAIIDYGMSNLGSISRAVEECGGDNVIITSNPDDVKTCDRMILPGVGSFSDGMENLQAGGWVEIIREEVIKNKIPILGICLGMQLLATTGYEGGKSNGLDLIQGSVHLMESTSKTEKIPHVGWNEVHQITNNALLENIESGHDFYFVHSYRFIPENESDIIGLTDYCGKVVSVVNRDNVFGTQFHPEKSIPHGFSIIENFLNY